MRALSSYARCKGFRFSQASLTMNVENGAGKQGGVAIKRADFWVSPPAKSNALRAFKIFCKKNEILCLRGRLPRLTPRLVATDTASSATRSK